MIRRAAAVLVAAVFLNSCQTSTPPASAPTRFQKFAKRQCIEYARAKDYRAWAAWSCFQHVSFDDAQK